jgi:hypothetical protein
MPTSEGSSPGSDASASRTDGLSGTDGSYPEAPRCPKPGTKVSEARKRELLQAGLASEEDFDRFTHGAPDEKQHFYRVDKTPSPAVR